MRFAHERNLEKATVCVALELKRGHGLRTVEAWLALKADRRLARVADPEAPYEIYLKVDSNLGTAIANARSPVQEEGHGLPSCYHYYACLALLHGVDQWPLATLTAYIAMDPTAEGGPSPSAVWRTALEKHAVHFSKLRKKRERCASGNRWTD